MRSIEDINTKKLNLFLLTTLCVNFIKSCVHYMLIFLSIKSKNFASNIFMKQIQHLVKRNRGVFKL